MCESNFIDDVLNKKREAVRFVDNYRNIERNVIFPDYSVFNSESGTIVNLTSYERFIFFVLHDLASRIKVITPELLLSLIHNTDIGNLRNDAILETQELLLKFQELIITKKFKDKEGNIIQINDYSPIRGCMNIDNFYIFGIHECEMVLPTVYTPDSFVLYV